MLYYAHYGMNRTSTEPTTWPGINGGKPIYIPANTRWPSGDNGLLLTLLTLDFSGLRTLYSWCTDDRTYGDQMVSLSNSLFDGMIAYAILNQLMNSTQIDSLTIASTNTWRLIHSSLYLSTQGPGFVLGSRFVDCSAHGIYADSHHSLVRLQRNLFLPRTSSPAVLFGLVGHRCSEAPSCGVGQVFWSQGNWKGRLQEPPYYVCACEFVILIRCLVLMS